MKATPEQQNALLRLQGLDTRLRQLDHRRRTLPESVDLAALEKQGAQLRDVQVAAETEVADLQRAQAKADADVTQVRERAKRDRARMESGAAAKELVGLQHELETLSRRQAELEDIELGFMEQLEAAQERMKTAAAQRARHDETAAALAATRDEKWAELDDEAERVRRERQEASAGIDEALLALYGSVAARSGTGAAPLEQNRCGGCRLELSPVDLAAISRAAPDDVVQCEECSCVLVR